MVWHVECQNTPITVCAGRKRVFESQCCGKGTLKTKTPKTTPFPFFSFLFQDENNCAIKQSHTNHLLKCENGKANKKTTTTVVTPLFEMVLSVVSTLLSLKTQNKHTHDG